MNKELLVRNFDEFINKFDPVVYSYYNAAVERISGFSGLISSNNNVLLVCLIMLILYLLSFVWF